MPKINSVVTKLPEKAGLTILRVTRAYRYYVHPFSKKLLIRNELDSVQMILNRKASLCRFGDAEIEVIYGRDHFAQRYSKRLANLLLESLRNQNGNFLVGVPNWDGLEFSSLEKQLHWRRLRIVADRYMDVRKEYLSSFVSRLFGVRDVDWKKVCKVWEQIWSGRRVMLVTSNPRLADSLLLQSAASISLRLIDQVDAFSQYDVIKDEMIKWAEKDSDIVLVAAGVMATALAYELSQNNIQCLDIGSLLSQFDARQSSGNIVWP